ncbi:acetyl-CoA carboxylase biotin carboxyl carrier protein subunit, partial [Roseospira navarrensis]|nr:acetyl-CoA carboxylase biotin carboxyl carrier protein subunit [Roseospira navarrensis]
MKKLRITVEGTVYDVTVETLEDDSAGAAAAPPPVRAAAPAAPSP